jgi:hypothetical protein
VGYVGSPGDRVWFRGGDVGVVPRAPLGGWFLGVDDVGVVRWVGTSVWFPGAKRRCGFAGSAA